MIMSRISRCRLCTRSDFPLFFVYSGAISVPLVFRSDPNRDPNAESGGIIRAGKDAAVKFSERKGAEMARNVR